MLYSVYAVKDELVSFGAPFISENDAAASRLILNAFNIPNSLYSTRPQDYTLYKIGTYDTESGELTPNVPKYITSCSNFKNEVK